MRPQGQSQGQVSDQVLIFVRFYLKQGRSHTETYRFRERDYLCEKRELAVDFLFCLALIELLKQLPFHPGQDDAVNHVITLVFRHLRYREP